MLGLKRISTITALVLLAGAWMVGCEDTPLTAPPDGEVRLTASPSTVVIDIILEETEADSTITAQVFDDRGRVMLGAEVVFTTSSGTLASGGPPNSVTTDSNGIATDILTLNLNDDASVDVNATSGALTQSVVVTKTVSAGNAQPTAKLVASPSVRAAIGQTVIFDGQTSSDPDGEITCYQFQVDSTVDSSDEVVQGQTMSSIQRRYTAEQSLTVTLRVSDDPDATTWCRGGGNPAPPDNFSPFTDFINGYEILCSTSDPTVNLATNPQTLQNLGGTVLLQGSATDFEADLTTYTWDCGNGSGDTQPVPVSGIIPDFTCVYAPNNDPQSIQYTASLRVSNTCGRTGEDKITVTVLGRL